MPEGPRGGTIRLHREDFTCECGKKYRNTLSYLKHHANCEAFYLPKLKSLITATHAACLFLVVGISGSSTGFAQDGSLNQLLE